jgi:hypothetical protein
MNSALERLLRSGQAEAEGGFHPRVEKHRPDRFSLHEQERGLTRVRAAFMRKRARS